MQIFHKRTEDPSLGPSGEAFHQVLKKDFVKSEDHLSLENSC